jgi:hypothetical protein
LRHQHTTLLCQKAYGFSANPSFSLQKNFRTAIATPSSPYFKQPKHLTFHNLCRDTTLPVGSKNLLGLNLKFCLSTKSLTNDINQTMLRMVCSIRTHHFLQTNGLNTTSKYEKQIYIKNTNWHPPPAPSIIVDKMTEFEKALKNKH